MIGWRCFHTSLPIRFRNMPYICDEWLSFDFCLVILSLALFGVYLPLGGFPPLSFLWLNPLVSRILCVFCVWMDWVPSIWTDPYRLAFLREGWFVTFGGEPSRPFSSQSFAAIPSSFALCCLSHVVCAVPVDGPIFRDLPHVSFPLLGASCSFRLRAFLCGCLPRLFLCLLPEVHWHLGVLLSFFLFQLAMTRASPRV